MLSYLISQADSKEDLFNNDLDPEALSITIPSTLAGLRLDAAMARIIPELSRSRLTNWIKDGLILLNGNLPKPKDKVSSGDTLIVNLPIKNDEIEFTAKPIDFEVLFEDMDIIIINKPKNLVVHPGAGNFTDTLLNGLIYRYPELKNVPRAGIVHRLDKDTTGLMVVARNLPAQTHLVRELQSHNVSRVYLAIAKGNICNNGKINKNIGRDPQNRIKMTTLQSGGKDAITHYKVLARFTNFTYLECRLETGRTHQIRVHLTSIGHPLAGDQTYGKGITYSQDSIIIEAIKKLNRQALHAFKLSFIHPIQKEVVSFEAPLPDDFKNLLEVLQQENDGV